MSRESKIILMELLILFFAIEIYIGFIRYGNPVFKKLFLLSMFAYMISSWIVRRDTLMDLGIKTGDWSGSKFVALMVIGNIALMAIAGHIFNPDFGISSGFSFMLKLIWYTVWGTIQQMIIQSYFTNRLLAAMPYPWQAIAISGILFSFVHFPNPALSFICLVNGLLSAYMFSKSRNIWLLGIGHAIIGSCVAEFLPWSWHHAMKIGPSF